MEGKRTRLISENAGEREQMDVEIREVDPFNLWVRASTSGSAHQGSSDKPCVKALHRAALTGGSSALIASCTRISYTPSISCNLCIQIVRCCHKLTTTEH